VTTLTKVDSMWMSKRLPVDLRPPIIPERVWDRLWWEINAETRNAEVRYGTGGELWATLSVEMAEDPELDLGRMLVEKVRRHYIMVHKPELFVC
jgi:hypothetical protein